MNAKEIFTKLGRLIIRSDKIIANLKKEETPLKMILSGTYSEYQMWRSRHPRTSSVYIESINDLYGKEPDDVEIIKLDSWYNNKLLQKPEFVDELQRLLKKPGLEKL